MKTRIKSWFALPAFLAVSNFSALPLEAQSVTALYSFFANPGQTAANLDGSNPISGVILSSNVLYGTTLDGGTAASGTIYRVNMDSTGFTNLHNFTDGTDGSHPAAALVAGGGALYGTTEYGGTNGSGVIFKVNTDGSGYTILHTFNANSDGAYPGGGLLLSGSFLYGTANGGGAAGAGTIFRMVTNGTSFVVLHNFNYTSDGGLPSSGLIISGSTLFGTAAEGGVNSEGTIFQLGTDGSAFTVLHSFSALTLGANNEGAEPASALVLSGDALFGTAPYGGTSGYGAIYSVHTDGTGFTNLHNFNGTTDGSSPAGGLVLNSNTLYGTTQNIGSDSNYFGNIFSININGSGFTPDFGFPLPSQTPAYTNLQGSAPLGGLIISSSTLYGTTKLGGAYGSGTVFKFDPHPAFFNGEIYLGGGVYYLAFTNGNFFGLYTYAFWPYLYHYDMGFEYYFPTTDAANGAYLYDFTSGHFWYTGPSFTFPNIYDFTLNAYIYYFPNSTNSGHYTSNPRQFYNYTSPQFFTQ